MINMTHELLEAYLDGEMTPDQKLEVDALLAQDAAWRETFRRMEHQRAVCRTAMASYTPTPTAAGVLARRMLEHCYEMEFAPVGRIAEKGNTAIRWVKRASVLAACLVIGVGCFLAGRGSIAAPAVRYAVEIQTPGGETVSQTFSSYEQAQRFYHTYQLSKQSVPTNNGNGPVRETMAMASQGVF